MGYGNFNTLFDQALDPSIPLVGAGVISGWVLKPGQSGQSYIQGLEGGNPDAHAWSKQGPYSSNADLFEAAKKSNVAQIRFASESEMAFAVEQALTTNIAEITSKANSGKPEVVRYSTTPVNYYGYQNHNGEVFPVSSVAPALIAIYCDGLGNWRLITAFPHP